MDDVTRHPDDATLFDLVEGALDDARAETVQAHLSRCPACAAFVAAARAGAAVSSSAVEEMPAEAVARLDVTVAAAWRDRVAGIAAAEALEDATPVAVGATDVIATAPIDADPIGNDSRPASARRRGVRRLVPVLAFVVLGTLAGTSLYLGEQQPKDGATLGRGEQETATENTAPEPPSPSAVDGGAIEAGAPPVADTSVSAGEPAGGEEYKVQRDVAAATGGAMSEAADAASSPVDPSEPPADYDEFVEQQQLCLVTRDQSQLVLPEGRIPTQITQGPLGLYLVCG